MIEFEQEKEIENIDKIKSEDTFIKKEKVEKSINKNQEEKKI